LSLILNGGFFRLATLKKFLDEELLELAGLTTAVTFMRRMKKLNTDQVYRQRKYNLLHEESEGYAKVVPESFWNAFPLSALIHLDAVF